MKIYTKVVMDYDGNIIEEESYEYDGPIAKCDSGDVKAPEPTAAERELQNIQLGQVRSSEREQAALRPFQLQSLGLISEPNPELNARAQELIDRRFALTGKAPGTFSSDPKIADLDREIAEANRAASQGTIRRLTEEERVSGLSPSQRRQEDIRTAQEERQLLALEGELPISEGFRQQKQSEFEKLKEALAQRGIEVSGDTPEEATSTSSPGIQALRQFKERFDLVESAQRQGEISQGTGNLLAIQSGITGVRQTQLQNQIAFPQRRAGFLSSVGQAFQPFQFNRQQQFQGNLQQGANRAQFTSDLFGLGGTVLGAGLSEGGFLR